MTDLKVYKLNKKENLVFCICLIISGIAASMLLYRNIYFSVIVIPFVTKIKATVEDKLAQRRKKQYITQFKDFLFMASTAIGAGRSMKDAIGESIPSLINIHGEDAVLVKDLSKAFERMEKGQEDDIKVLDELAKASGLEDVEDFVTVYSICKTSGASLITALSRAANVIMEKMSIDREIEELVHRKESEGLILMVMPIAVIIFLNVFAPDYIAPMYETIAGRCIMSVAAAAACGVYVMIKRITNVEI